MRTKRWYRNRVEELEEEVKKLEEENDGYFEEANQWFDKWHEATEEVTALELENHELRSEVFDMKNKIVFGNVTMHEHQMLETELDDIRTEKWDLEHELFCERIRIKTLIEKLKELGYEPEDESGE